MRRVLLALEATNGLANVRSCNFKAALLYPNPNLSKISTEMIQSFSLLEMSATRYKKEKIESIFVAWKVMMQHRSWLALRLTLLLCKALVTGRSEGSREVCPCPRYAHCAFGITTWMY